MRPERFCFDVMLCLFSRSIIAWHLGSQTECLKDVLAEHMRSMMKVDILRSLRVNLVRKAVRCFGTKPRRRRSKEKMLEVEAVGIVQQSNERSARVLVGDKASSLVISAINWLTMRLKSAIYDGEQDQR